MASKDKTKNLVNKATTDNRDPPSGYLLRELSKRTTSIQECQTIEDLIVKKLQKKQPYVKYKALRVIKYLCENGSSNWRRAWQRNTDKLRDAQQFRGPPDPIYGDAPYQQVRKAAKDAMQSVFQSSQIDNSNITSRIKSIDGGSAYSSEAARFGSGSTGVFSIPKKSKAPSAPGNKWDNRGSAPTKQMQGFGNNNYVPNARKTTFEPLKSSGGYSNPAVLTGSNPHSSGKLDNRGYGHKRKKGTVGGGWGPDPSQQNDDDDEDSEDDADDDYNADRFPSNNENSVSSTSNSRKFGGNIRSSSRGNSKSDGHYEQKWVNGIIRGGGIGAKIPGIDKYIEQFENLSKSHILEFLDDKLEDSDWKKQGKTLTLINALITKGRSGNDVIEYFSQCPDNIQTLTNANKSILRKNANAIMNHLDIDQEDDAVQQPVSSAKASKVAPQSVQSVPTDLLDLSGPATTTQTVQNNVGGNDDIMSFTQNLGGDDDDEDDEDDGDMFGNLNTKDNTNNAVVSLIPDGALPTKEELQANANKRNASDYDFLDGMVTNINVKQGDNRNNNDILNMGFNNNNNNNPNVSSGGGDASAFGFDLGGANNTQNSNNNNTTSAFGLGGVSSGNANNSNNNIAQSAGPSAFGFDLGGAGGGGNTNTNMNMNNPNQAMNVNMGNQTQNPSSSSFGFMNPQMNNNMMTNTMMQANAQNRQFTQNSMNQLNSMMNQMTMGGQPNMVNNNMNMNRNMNAFQQTMTTMNAPQQMQNPMQNPMMQPTYNHNDPFAQMMSGAKTVQPAPPTRQTKPAMDPFSAFSLKAMK